MTESVSSFASLGRMFEEYRPRLSVMLERRIDPSLARRVDPDDVLNEAFIAARTRWPSVSAQMQTDSPGSTPSSKQYAWLYRLVLDTLIEVYRRHTRHKRDLRLDLPWPDASSIQLGLGLINNGTSPSEAVMRTELQQHVRKVVSLLKEDAATVCYARALVRLRALWRTLRNEGSLL